MKATILSGLIAVALGGLTSCSNILEENGVINNVAESGMGELRINLTTDASLNVSTKGGVSKNGINKENFTYKVKESQATESLIKTYSEFPLTLPTGTYSVTATYDQMVNEEGNTVPLAWDKPSFYGESSPVKLSGTATINATLSNSVISFDKTATETAFKDKATISEVFVYVGNKEYAQEDKYILYDGSTQTQETQTLFVAAGQKNVYIHIDGTVQDSKSTKISHSTLIAGRKQENGTLGETTQTFAANEYKVAYTLNDDKGLLSLTINISGTTQDITITEEIDPYPTTPAAE